MTQRICVLKKITYIICALSLFMGGCPVYDPPSGLLTVINNSDSTIFVYESCTDSINTSPELKTVLKAPGKMVNSSGDKMDNSFFPDYRIETDSMTQLDGYGTNKNKRVFCRNKSITLFFIKHSTIKDYSWREIYENQIYEEKRTYEENELDSLNWIIRYP